MLTAIHRAIFCDDLDAVCQASGNPGNLTSLNDQGQTPLGHAISRMVSHRENDVAIIRTLLDAGADPEAGGTNEPTPLVGAIEARDSSNESILEVVAMLVAAGADLHRNSRNSRLDMVLTPIEAAVLVPNAEVADWFLRHGAKPPSHTSMRSKIAKRVEFAESIFGDADSLETECNVILRALNS